MKEWILFCVKLWNCFQDFGVKGMMLKGITNKIAGYESKFWSASRKLLGTRSELDLRGWGHPPFIIIIIQESAPESSMINYF